MRLTIEQILSATNGIVSFEQNEFGLELHRFSKNQEEFFSKPHPLFSSDSFFDGYFLSNCRTTAGITIDFESDLTTLIVEFGKIEYSKNKSVTAHFFDLYVDDVLVKSYEVGEKIIYNSTGKKHRFSLCFPVYVFPIISLFKLENASTFLPLKKPVDILFLGDSITHGNRSVHPSNTYVMRVARKLGVGILNQGNGGFVYDADSIEKICEPKIVITAYGVNDYIRKDINQIESQTTIYFKKLKEVYKKSKIVSILPLWTLNNEREENWKSEERNCLKNVYQKYSDLIIDGFDLVPHDKKYFADSCHPNEEGFKCYGENLSKQLQKLLQNFEV